MCVGDFQAAAYCGTCENIETNQSSSVHICLYFQVSAAVKESEETAAHHALLANRRAEANSKLNGLRKQLGSNGVPYSARSSARSNASSAAFSARKNRQSARKAPPTMQQSNAAAGAASLSAVDKNTKSGQSRADSCAASERSQEEAPKNEMNRNVSNSSSQEVNKRSNTSARNEDHTDTNRDVANERAQVGQNIGVPVRDGRSAMTVNASQKLTTVPARHNQCTVEISDSDDDNQVRASQVPAKTNPHPCRKIAVDHVTSDNGNTGATGASKNDSSYSANSLTPSDDNKVQTTQGVFRAGTDTVHQSRINANPNATRASSTAGNERTQMERGRLTKKHVRAALVIQEWYRQRRKTRMFRNLAAAAGSRQTNQTIPVSEGSRQTHGDTTKSHGTNATSADACSSGEDARVLKASHAVAKRGNRRDAGGKDETSILAHCEAGHGDTSGLQARVQGLNTTCLPGERSATTPQHVVKKKPAHDGVPDCGSMSSRTASGQRLSNAQDVAASTVQRTFRGYIGREAARKQRQLKRVALLNGMHRLSLPGFTYQAL
jgi:hypothetical protein